MNSTLSVVLIGSFSPAMFSPYWFFKNRIINEDVFDFISNSKETFISSAFTIFQTDSFRVRIEQERFTIEAKETPFSVFVEFFKSIFNGLNTMTIKSYGFNFSSSYKLNEDNFGEFGRKVCPRKNFKKFFSNSIDEKNAKNGLIAISLSSQREKCIYNLSISSSKRVKFCIDFNSNFHHESNKDYFIGEVVDDLESNWKELLTIHNETIKDVLEATIENVK